MAQQAGGGAGERQEKGGETDHPVSKASYDLPGTMTSLHRPGAMQFNPGDILELHSRPVGTGLDHDPGELERIEERLFALRAAARKFKCTVDTLADVRQRIGDRADAMHGNLAGTGRRRMHGHRQDRKSVV